MRQGYMLSIATRYQRRNETNNTIALRSFPPDFLQEHPQEHLSHHWETCMTGSL